MPLMRINLVKGRSKSEVKAIGEAVHRAMVTSFKVPERDRYQIINELKSSRFVMEDTGLDIPRTKQRILIEVITRPRPREQKEQFYKLVCEELERAARIAPTDVMISIVENSDDDWSFGHGRAQFLTGEL